MRKGFKDNDNAYMDFNKRVLLQRTSEHKQLVNYNQSSWCHMRIPVGIPPLSYLGDSTQQQILADLLKIRTISSKYFEERFKEFI